MIEGIAVFGVATLAGVAAIILVDVAVLTPFLEQQRPGFFHQCLAFVCQIVALQSQIDEEVHRRPLADTAWPAVRTA